MKQTQYYLVLTTNSTQVNLNALYKRAALPTFPSDTPLSEPGHHAPKLHTGSHHSGSWFIFTFPCMQALLVISWSWKTGMDYYILLLMDLLNKPDLLCTPAESRQATSYTRIHRNQHTNSLDSSLHIHQLSRLMTNTQGIGSLDRDVFSSISIKQP